jgi:hypothetical protein
MGSNPIKNMVFLKIGICYIAFLTIATALCFRVAGVREIVSYASASKPYSFLFRLEPEGGEFYRLLQPETQKGFSHHRTTGDRRRSASILCFGDSNMFHPDGDGSKNLALLLEEALGNGVDSPPPKVSKWDFAGASMFDYYCMFYWTAESPPDLIIVPINWRTFGEGWLQSETFFFPELSALAPIFRKQSPGTIDPIKSRGISAIKQIEYKVSLYSVYFIGIRGWGRASLKALLDRPDDGEANRGDADQARDPKFTAAVNEENDMFARASGNPTSLARQFPMEIGESNPVLLALEALANIISDHDAKVLFYVWPVDYEYHAEIGTPDDEAFERSMSLIADAVNGKNTHFVDLSHLLEHRYFFDRNGHCKVAGRRKIAQALASTVRSILKERPEGVTNP